MTVRLTEALHWMDEWRVYGNFDTDIVQAVDTIEAAARKWVTPPSDKAIRAVAAALDTGVRDPFILEKARKAVEAYRVAELGDES